MNGVPGYIPSLTSPLSKCQWDLSNLKFFKTCFQGSGTSKGETGESEGEGFKRHVAERKVTANHISAWLDEAIGKKQRYVFIFIKKHRHSNPLKFSESGEYFGSTNELIVQK